jgi:hypothetical protein
VDHNLNRNIAHGIHAGHSTNAGNTVLQDAARIGADVLTPIVVLTLVPFMPLTLLGFGMFKLLDHVGVLRR